jgi:hypothetical protein
MWDLILALVSPHLTMTHFDITLVGPDWAMAGPPIIFLLGLRAKAGKMLIGGRYEMILTNGQ